MAPKSKNSSGTAGKVAVTSAQPCEQRKGNGDYYLLVDHNGNPSLFDKHGAEAPASLTSFLREEPRLKMAQWFVSVSPGRVAFLEQGVGIGFIDFQRRAVILDVGNDKVGDEFSCVAVASDGALWVCASENGESYGAIVDSSGTCRPGQGFGPVPCGGSDGGYSDDDKDGDFETHSAVSVASLAPHSTEMVVSSHQSELWVYQEDGVRCPRNIALPFGSKSWAICAVSRSGAPLLVCIVEGNAAQETAESRDKAGTPCTAADRTKRLRKVLRVAPSRCVVVICADTAALVKVYDSWPSEPVDLAALPDGSVAVVTVDSLLQIWPAAEDTAVRPFFLAPTPAQRFTCRPVAVQVPLTQ